MINIFKKLICLLGAFVICASSAAPTCRCNFDGERPHERQFYIEPRVSYVLSQKASDKITKPDRCHIGSLAFGTRIRPRLDLEVELMYYNNKYSEKHTYQLDYTMKFASALLNANFALYEFGEKSGRLYLSVGVGATKFYTRSIRTTPSIIGDGFKNMPGSDLAAQVSIGIEHKLSDRASVDFRVRGLSLGSLRSDPDISKLNQLAVGIGLKLLF